MKEKLVKKLFVVVKLAQYFVCEGDRKLASYYKQEICVLKLGKLFSQTQVSFLVVNTAKYKRGIIPVQILWHLKVCLYRTRLDGVGLNKTN